MFFDRNVSGAWSKWSVVKVPFNHQSLVAVTFHCLQQLVGEKNASWQNLNLNWTLFFFTSTHCNQIIVTVNSWMDTFTFHSCRRRDQMMQVDNESLRRKKKKKRNLIVILKKKNHCRLYTPMCSVTDNPNVVAMLC